jgi:hypothetical protein
MRCDNGGEYISNELNDVFPTRAVIHGLTPPYSPESNRIGKYFNQTINTIACSMTITASDIPCLWAEASNMAAYLKESLPYKYLPSSSTPFERFHSKRPTISHLKAFRSKCYVHIQVEERSSRSKHRPCACEAIIVRYTTSPKVYRGFTLEDKYVFRTWDLTFAKKSSPQVVTTLCRIFQDPKTDPESTSQDQGPKVHSTTISVHTKMLPQDMVSDQDWCRYLFKYPDKAVTFYDPGHPVVRQLVRLSIRLTRNHLKHHNPHRRHLLTPNKVSWICRFRVLCSACNVPRQIVLLNLTSLNQTSSDGPSDSIDIDSSAQTITRTGRVYRTPGKLWVTLTTNADTLILDFNNLRMDRDEEDLNTSHNILDDGEPKFYRQAISRPNADLWYSAIKAEMDAFRRNHTWDVGDRPTERKIVDSK